MIQEDRVVALSFFIKQTFCSGLKYGNITTWKCGMFVLT